MNILFQMQKPRRFHHQLIYSDERQERLARIEQRAGSEPEKEGAQSSVSADRQIHLSIGRMRHRPSARVMGNGSLGLGMLLLVLFTMVLLLVL